MLIHFKIDNFALIDSTELDLRSGLSVLTGETGSGKTLILDALSSVLGGRCSTSYIRQGSDHYRLMATFSLSHLDDAKDWLREKGFRHESEEITLKKELYRDGKSRIWIGDSLASLHLLREFGNLLTEIHTQNDQIYLSEKLHQLELLDRYSGLESKRKTHRQFFLETKSLQKRIQDWKEREISRQRKMEILEFQIQEIESAKLSSNEESELLREEQLLSNGEKISENLQLITNLLTQEETGALSQLFKAQNSIQKITKILPEYQDISEEWNEILSRLKSISSHFQTEEEELFFSPERLETIQSRLSILGKLKKKYGMEIPHLIGEVELWKREYQELETEKNQSSHLAKELEVRLNELKSMALEMSKTRRNSVLNFEKAIQTELASLDLVGSRLQIVLRWEESQEGDIQEGEKSYNLGEYGLDQVEFYFSANPGEKPRPLRKVASGGELSRILLAIHSVLGSKNSTGKLLVFDEIDAGVGGEAASSMAEKLAKLSHRFQILLITHTQQIAAIAWDHWKVEKKVFNNQTTSNLLRVSAPDRPLEIARMIAGKDMTQAALEHARELLKKKAS